jgi:class 3 adenylate cyclase/tetratricopeptide (TPR) repeat protein
MNCPKCQAALPDDAAFCGHCGSALRSERTCARCGRSNSPEMRFCVGCGSPFLALGTADQQDPRTYTPKHLAEKILTSRAALEGERKQVTVLFADVKGSMDLAERVDPEEWHRILDGFFTILAEGVHRFEGTVNQYTGDGIMALFGAPIAHEDHAQRACYAALHLTEALGRYARELKREQGLTFSVRMGLNSGEVVVGKIGDDLRMDYTAQGHTVGLAQRMEQLASPDTVYLTGATAALVSGYFDLDDLGRFAVKGVREPVAVFQLRGVGPLRTRFDVSRARGLTRFVGRGDDLRTLEAALGRAREGDGQVVGVVGEAGIGKTRLCHELVQRCRAEGLTVLEGHAVAHGKNIPFLPMLEIFRAYYGITAEDGERTAREKIAGRLLLMDETFRDVLPVVFDFLGVPDPEAPPPPMDPDLRQRLIAGVLGRLLRRGRQAVVTLIDDLHWIDGGSEAILEHWVDALAGTRNLLLVTFRPEYRARWMEKSYSHRLSLLPLPPEAIRELLDDLLGHNPSLTGLAEAIHARTGGNPFFTEEVVRSLVEAGLLEGTRGHHRLTAPVTEVAVPDTVQAVLAARIDRLPEREKQVLQDAAVIGREFTEPVLAAVAEVAPADLTEALAKLTSAEFLDEQALYPVAEYAFRHPLTQEVAYASQLGERRRRTHAAAARALERLHPGSVGEKAALLAQHWERAGEGLQAARWHRRAAEWAGASDAAEALRHWEQVLALLAPLPDTDETIAQKLVAIPQSLNLSNRLGSSEEWARALFEEGKQLAERVGDLRALAGLFYAYGVLRVNAGELEDGRDHVAEAAGMAERIGDEGWTLALRMGLCFANGALGRLEEVLQLAERVLAEPPENRRLGARIVGFSPFLGILLQKALALTWTGRLREAQPILDQALDLARDDAEIEMRRSLHGQYSEWALLAGDARLAAGHVRHAVDIAERLGSTRSRQYAYRALGALKLLEGQWREAAETLEGVLALAREKRTALQQEASWLADLAEAYLGLGDAGRARAAASEAVALGRRRRARLDECRAHLALARVLLRAEGAAASGEIEAALHAACALVEETGARTLEPFIHVELAELARLANDDATRQRELREAHRLFTEMGAPIRAAEVARALES